MRRLGLQSLAMAFAVWLSAFPPAQAQTQAQSQVQDWPARPVRIIIPLGAGGGGDVFARLLAEELRKRLGQPFVVENRTGGALNIGMRACAESPPDGYTFCITSSEPIVYNQFLFKTLPFNPETDFEPITNLFFNPVAVVANAGLKIGTLDEMMALAKAKPGTLSYSTFSFPLVAFMDKMNKKHGVDIIHVPYRSGNEVVNGVVSGTTPIAILGLSNMLAQVRAGAIVGIALNANSRSPLFPNIPTLQEASGEDFPPAWFGLFAPKGTPKPIIEKLHSEVVRIASDSDFRQKNFIERAIDYAINTPDEFAKFIVKDRASAGRIVSESGKQPQ